MNRPAIFAYGDIVVDILTYHHGALNRGSDTVGTVEMRGGGSAANFAAWAAGGNSGGNSDVDTDVTFFGRVGDDYAAGFLKTELEIHGVTAMFSRAPCMHTGSIVVLVDCDGERTMVTDRGANRFCSLDDMPLDTLLASDHLHVTGYSLFEDRELIAATTELIARARSAGLSVSVDPSSWALLRDFGPQRFMEITEGCDLIFPNIEEGSILTGKTDPEAIALALQPRYGTVVLKRGVDSPIVAREGKITPLEPAVEVQEKPIDTTGAGDAFAAGFVTAWLRDSADLAGAAAAAARTARICISHHGGRPLSVPTNG